MSTGTISAAGGAGEPVQTGNGSRPRQVALVDLLDRLLGAGVVLSGDITISIAGVDLVEVRLHALITSVRADMRTIGPNINGPTTGGVAR